MTSSITDHRATRRGRTHLRCIESSHNDIINSRSQSYKKIVGHILDVSVFEPGIEKGETHVSPS